MARVETPVEVRPTCPACGSMRVIAIRTDLQVRIVTRRCESCGVVRKFRIMLANEVRVYEGEVGSNN